MLNQIFICLLKFSIVGVAMFINILKRKVITISSCGWQTYLIKIKKYNEE